MKRAFNKRIPVALVKRVKETSSRCNVSEDLVVETAIRFFFDNTRTDNRPDAFFSALSGRSLRLDKPEPYAATLATK